MPEKVLPSITTRSPRCSICCSLHICMLAVSRAIAAGSPSAMKFSARPESTTPKPKVASFGFCSMTRTVYDGQVRFIR